MAETRVQTQVRLVLEQQCAEAFMVLVDGPLRGHDFTLLFLDYGPTGNGAFKTTLPLPDAIKTWEALLKSWRTGSRRVGTDAECGRIAALDIPAIGTAVQTPARIGIALLVGRGGFSSYFSTCDRAGVIEMAETELLPWWRRSLEAGRG